MKDFIMSNESYFHPPSYLGSPIPPRHIDTPAPEEEELLPPFNLPCQQPTHTFVYLCHCPNIRHCICLTCAQERCQMLTCAICAVRGILFFLLLLEYLTILARQCIQPRL